MFDLNMTEPYISGQMSFFMYNLELIFSTKFKENRLKIKG